MALLHLILAMLFSECLGVTYVDLSHSLHNDTMHWPTAMPVTVQVVAKGETTKGYWYESNNICLAEHAGTHLDAPAHFFKERWHADDIPLSRLMGPGVVLDIQEKAKKNPLAELAVDDITSWTEANGPLPDGAVVFVLTGWGSRYGDKLAYFGTNNSDGSNLKFPGISLDAAKYLTALKGDSGLGVVGVGIDTSTANPTHVELFEDNIYVLENVAKLEMLPAKGFRVIVKPMSTKRVTDSTIPDNGFQVMMNPTNTTKEGIVPVRIFASIQVADDDASTSILDADDDDDASTSIPDADDDDDASTSIPDADDDDDASTSIPDADADAASTSIPDADADAASTSIPDADDDDASTSIPDADDDDASTSIPDADDASAHGAVTYLAPVLLVLIAVMHIITV
ncbi:uncharacterized protein [Penaeus vannamei]|uniref:uncharacterized protein isoform X1 n=1 Tax=Penaeus vannamei TaxID=6689 RepID=UPI00387FA665